MIDDEQLHFIVYCKLLIVNCYSITLPPSTLMACPVM